MVSIPYDEDIDYDADIPYSGELTMASPGYISGELNITVGAVYVDPPGDDKRHATLDLSQASAFRLTVTDTDDFDLDLEDGSPAEGDTFTLTIVNDAGDDMGTVTWDADLVPYGVTFALPEDGGSTTYTFAYDGTIWRALASTTQEAGVFRTTVLLSSADILALDSTEFVVVPAPGESEFISVSSAAILYLPGGTGYTAEDISVGYEGGATDLITFPDPATGGDAIWASAPVDNSVFFSEMIGKAVVLRAAAALEDGDGALLATVVWSLETAPSIVL